ncbi:hypothetical protein V6Z12_D05G351900 [Gossypium hirsutum]
MRILGRVGSVSGSKFSRNHKNTLKNPRNLSAPSRLSSETNLGRSNGVSEYIECAFIANHEQKKKVNGRGDCGARLTPETLGFLKLLWACD